MGLRGMASTSITIFYGPSIAFNLIGKLKLRMGWWKRFKREGRGKTACQEALINP
jgi:hypothetical protein